MLKKLFDAVSYLCYAPQTQKKQLDVIIQDITLFKTGDDYGGTAFTEPVYMLSLECAEQPAEIIKGNWTKTSFEGFNALIGADEIDEALLQKLTPGSKAAVSCELTCDGKSWAYFINHGGMGSQTYYLATIEPGQAKNPVNPSDVLATVYLGKTRQYGPSPTPD